MTVNIIRDGVLTTTDKLFLTYYMVSKNCNDGTNYLCHTSLCVYVLILSDRFLNDVYAF